MKYIMALIALIIAVIIDVLIINKNQNKFNDFKILDFIRVRKFTKFDFSIIFYLQTILLILHRPLNSLFYEVNLILLLFVIVSLILMAGIISLIRSGIYKLLKRV